MKGNPEKRILGPLAILSAAILFAFVSCSSPILGGEGNPKQDKDDDPAALVTIVNDMSIDIVVKMGDYETRATTAPLAQTGTIAANETLPVFKSPVNTAMNMWFTYFDAVENVNYTVKMTTEGILSVFTLEADAEYILSLNESGGEMTYEFVKVVNELPTALAPTFTPPAGEYDEPIEVTIQSATPGAAIRYTVNGNPPTADSPVYSGPIRLSASATIKAIAVIDGQNPSAAASAAYAITWTPPLEPADPVANAGANQATTPGQPVTLDGSASTVEPGSTISYNWAVVSYHHRSDYSLSSATAMTPTFTAWICGDYILSLTVSDGTTTSVADSVTVSVSLPAVETGGTLIRAIHDDANGKIYGLDAANKDLLVIDTASKSVEERYDLTYVPNNLAYDPADNRLFIVNSGSSLITEFDLETGTASYPITWDHTDNGNFEPGAKVGHYYEIEYYDDTLYLVDQAWAPALWIIDLSGETPVVTDLTGSVDEIGGFVFNAAHTEFYTWYQYGLSAGFAGSNVYRYGISGTTVTQIAATEIGYPDFMRDPLDTPIFLDETGNRVIAKDRVFSGTGTLSTLYTFPEEIYAVDLARNRAYGKDMIYTLDTYDGVSSIPIDRYDQLFIAGDGTRFFLSNGDQAIYWMEAGE